MAFTTQSFIFFFFPFCMAAYYIVAALQKKGRISALLSKLRAADLCIIGIGCCFYLWACFDDLIRLLIYVCAVYFAGMLIEKSREKIYIVSTNGSPEEKRLSAAKPILIAALGLIIFVLVQFKYTGMAASVWNFLFKDNVQGKSVLAPLGISFISFSAISYLVDIYRGAAPRGGLIDCALYLTFFPKVVSGPIVLWRDFMPQIGNRGVDTAIISDGIDRIMVGFAKKLILADTFGACISSAAQAIDVQTAFGMSLLYMLQIYFDFSGYSDIAIGLSNMLGFSMKENFNFPYLSCSIGEFWRRWHISLGTWFREYIYFPMGGSREGKTRTMLNIGVVFALTGIWHGAGWAYMLWGMLNGVFNVLERSMEEYALYRKTPKFMKWFATMMITFFCWQLFRFGSISDALNWFKIMFGIVEFDTIPYNYRQYFDTRMVVLMSIAMIGATVWGLPKVQAVYKKVTQHPVGYVIHELVVLLLFVVAIMFMVNSKYSPFIYFQY